MTFQPQDSEIGGHKNKMANGRHIEFSKMPIFPLSLIYNIIICLVPTLTKFGTRAVYGGIFNIGK